MKLINIYVNGIQPAIKSIRNAMQSWTKSDSTFEMSTDLTTGIDREKIGEKDLKLASNLVRAGASDGKFARGIQVAFEIKAPAYWIAELATYKVGTVMNSSSLQHTGMKRDYIIDDFEIDKKDKEWDNLLEQINKYRRLYVQTKDYHYFRLMRQFMPQSYLYTITWTANYQVLRNIYKDRRNHKLVEWRTFCKWVELLPYSNELITIGIKKEDK